MHPTVIAAIAIGAILLFILIIVALVSLVKRLTGRRSSAGGATKNGDEHENLLLGETSPAKEAKYKSDKPPGTIGKLREMLKMTPIEELPDKLKEHFEKWPPNELFGMWDRNILHYGVGLGQADRIKIILDMVKDHVDIDAKTKTGTSAMYMAAEKNQVDVVELFIDYGADLTITGKDDDTIMVGAVKHSAGEVVAMLFEKKPEVATEMLNKTNKKGQTALYWTVKKGMPETTSLLLEKGAGLIKTSTSDKKTALHVAVEEGILQTVKVLFEYFPQKWGTKDGHGDTAMHIAVMNDNSDVVEFLFEKNDFLAAYKNDEGMNPLEVAEFYNSTKSISVLESAEILDPDTGKPADKFPMKALFKACKEGRADTVSRLLREKEDERATMKIFRQVNSDFDNCLEVAIQNGQVDIAAMILDDDEWKDALCNDNRWTEGRGKLKGYSTPMRMLIRSFPTLAQNVLDKCCTIRDECSDALKIDFCVDLDYRFIEDADLDLNTIDLSPEFRPGAGIFRDLFDGTFHKRYTANEATLKKKDPLTVMVEFEREGLLKHPLTNFMIEQRWSLIKFPFLVCTFFYVLLAICVTGMIAGLKQNHALSGLGNGTCSDSCDAIKANTFLSKTFDEADAFTKPFQILIFVLAVILFCLEFLGMIADGLKYFKMENIIENFVLLSSILFVLQMTECGGLRCGWQWSLVSVTVFFAWMSVIIEFQVFANFGVFTLMFLHILKTFASIFLVLAPFIVGFAYAFYAVLDQTAVLEKFNNESSVYTVMKVGVMTIGEINSDLFFDALVDGQVKGGNQQLIVVVFFILFLIVMPIIIMNLLVGLAVGDIGEIRDIAEMEKIRSRIETIQEVQYSRRNQVLVKRLFGFFFKFCFNAPEGWRRAAIIPNNTGLNRLRKRFMGGIDHSAGNELKKDIVSEETVTLESRINDLEVSIKREVSGVVKEDDLQNVKDDMLEKIRELLEERPKE